MTRRSKYYVAAESWTRRPAWAFEIPLRALHAKSEILLRCETGPDSGAYTEVKVPAAFLETNPGELWIREDRKTISLFLSAEPQDRFTDKRGKAEVSFAQFAT